LAFVSHSLSLPSKFNITDNKKLNMFVRIEGLYFLILKQLAKKQKGQNDIFQINFAI